MTAFGNKVLLTNTIKDYTVWSLTGIPKHFSKKRETKLIIIFNKNIRVCILLDGSWTRRKQLESWDWSINSFNLQRSSGGKKQQLRSNSIHLSLFSVPNLGQADSKDEWFIPRQSPLIVKHPHITLSKHPECFGHLNQISRGKNWCFV